MHRCLCILTILLLGFGSHGQSAASKHMLTGKVVTVTLSNSEVAETRRWREVRKMLDESIAAGVTALVFDINVTSGKAQTALPMAEEIARLKVRTLAFVNPSAIAGGALFALGCDEIWMSPGARIGAAPPVIVSDEKTSLMAQETLMAESLAVLKAGARSLCKLKGHNAELAQAFIDKNVEFISAGRTLSAKGELLLLDGDDASVVVDGRPLLARGVMPDAVAVARSAGLAGEVLALTSELLAQPESAGVETNQKNSAISISGTQTTAKVAGPYTGKVVVIPVGEEDLIARARFEFMSRTLERCTAEGAEAVIFDLDTPGGLAWDTTNLMMKDLQKLKPRSFAYVNPRALSAGAMIAIATDEIYMAPASSAGAATPVYGGGGEMGEAERAKMNSAIMSMARTVAKEKGRDPRVIEAMIDMNRELVVNGEVLCAKGEILTLDAEQAILQENGRSIFARAIVTSLDDIKKAEGLKGEIVTAEPTGFEHIAILVTKYAAMLILIGIAGGYLEMQAPGFGIPGFISLAAFGLFFFGHYVAGSLVGQETAVVAGLFVLGVVLLLVEIFVVPGSLVFGITGFVCIMVALVYTMSGWDVSSPVPGTLPAGEQVPAGISFELSTYATGLRNFAVGIIGAAVVMVLLGRYLPEAKPFQKLVLIKSAGGTLAATPAMASVSSAKLGDVGVSRSVLRPYGTIEIGGRTMEATVEGGFIQAGVPVRVRDVQGPKIIVEAVG
jgi:membrane-bound serine protease (ClpP class)